MSKREWHRVWAASSLLIMGGVIGGLVGYLGIDEPTDAQTKRYVIVLGLAAFLAGVCFLARLTTKAQRDDSVQAIKEDLDTLLAAYPMPEESP